MGFVDKLKNLFTEEEEEMEETPVKKEVIHVDIPAPVKPKEEEKEVPVEKEEEKFKFPVYFDDKDFDELKSEPKEAGQPAAVQTGIKICKRNAICHTPKAAMPGRRRRRTPPRYCCSEMRRGW